MTSFVRYWQAIVYAGADGFLVSLMVILLLSKRARKAPFALAACAFLFFFAGTWISRVAVSVEVRNSPLVRAYWLTGSSSPDRWPCIRLFVHGNRVGVRNLTSCSIAPVCSGWVRRY